jgi:release factor glutamine methyltransferase
VKKEPQSALDGGDDGLTFYKHIIANAPYALKPGGWLFFEIGEMKFFEKMI